MVILRKRGLLDNHKVANFEFCKHCVIGKQKRVSFLKAIHQTKVTLDYLYADYWGPFRVPSLGGAWYFLSIVDDFSRMMWVFMMKQKSEAFEKFKHLKILIENHSGRKIKRLRLIMVWNFILEGLMTFAEIKELENSMLTVDASLDRKFCAEAINTACYLINRSPANAIDCKTPIEVWSGKLAYNSKLHDTVMGLKAIEFGHHLEEESFLAAISIAHDRPRRDVTSPDEQDRSIAHDRPRRNEKAPSRFGFEDYVAHALQVTKEVESLKPATYREAITSKDSDMWIAAWVKR
nr:hypothetical protein [Tanacetum cinerariifolium]